MRESKAVEVAETLLGEGHEISAVEPNIQSHKDLLLLNLLDAIEHADIICVLVKHREFLQSQIKEKLCFIDIYIDKEHRKNNFGQNAINQAIDFIILKYTLDYIIALVLKTNVKSLNFFYSLGFGKFYNLKNYLELRLKVEKK